jgi:predicted pyridoxine 5'-phosphate oxidase superfamily flavin-nucleotide-binding protein
VRVLDPKTIAFPCYDGNGMFYSIGNVAGNDKVGMLFVNFVRPHRLRVQGLARISDDDPLLSNFFEAQMIVRVSVTEIFRNCPRYVHRYDKIASSESVPRVGMKTPLAGWKRVDAVQAELAAKDKGRAEREGGTCSREEYEKYMDHVSSDDSGG